MSRCLVLVTSFSYTWAHNSHCNITFGQTLVQSFLALFTDFYPLFFTEMIHLTSSYTEDGTITTSLPPDPSDVLDLTDAIEKSVAATTSTSEGLTP